MIQVYNDEFFMRRALLEAENAASEGEIPVGAVVVCGDRIIACAHNQTELLKDVTAHAEILALTAAANFLGNKYLDDCTLYVTLEPCAMCAGALGWAKLGRIVWAASDEKRGFARFSHEILHPKTVVEHGLLANEAALLMKNFFKEKR